MATSLPDGGHKKSNLMFTLSSNTKIKEKYSLSRSFSFSVNRLLRPIHIKQKQKRKLSLMFVIYYWPQTKFTKVMFLHLSVSHSVHRGSAPVHAGMHTPPPDQRQAPPPDQRRAPPPDQRQTPPNPPPDQRQAPPPEQCMLGDTGNKIFWSFSLSLPLWLVVNGPKSIVPVAERTAPPAVSPPGGAPRRPSFHPSWSDRSRTLTSAAAADCKNKQECIPVCVPARSIPCVSGDGGSALHPGCRTPRMQTPLVMWPVVHDEKPHLVDRQTGVKTLPIPKLRLRTLTMPELYFMFQATGVLKFTTGLFMYLPAENDARLDFLRHVFL